MEEGSPRGGAVHTVQPARTEFKRKRKEKKKKLEKWLKLGLLSRATVCR